MPVSWLLIGAAAVFGLVIGSFLNVVIWRVPRDESVVTPNSRCPACETPIAPRDNVPVLSWVVLRGRARCCGERISARYPLVEAATAVAFGAVVAWEGPTWLLPALLYLAAISIALFMIDIDVKRLPDAIVLPSYPVAAALLALAAVPDGEYGTLVRAALAGLALYAFYFVLNFIYPAGMGFGDVKFGGILGMYLGYFGWSEVVVGTFFGFLIGGIAGIGLIVSGIATRKTAIPFGPYMIVGAWIALAVGGAVGDWYLEGAGFR